MLKYLKLMIISLSLMCLTVGSASALTKKETQQLLQQINSSQKEIKRYKKNFETQKDEERTLTAFQFLKREKALREKLDQLVEQVTSNSTELPESEVLRKQTLALLNEQSTTIKEEILLIESFIDKTTAEHKETATTIDKMTNNQRQEKGIRLLDDHMEALYNNAEQLKALGEDPESDLIYLDQLLNTYTIKSASQLELVKTTLEDVSDLLSFVPEDTKAELASRSNILEHKKSNIAKSLSRRIALMDLRGLDTTNFHHILIAATGQVSGDIFDSEVAFDLIQRSSEAMEEWLMENGIDLVWKLLLFVVIIILFKALSNISGRIVSSALQKSNLKLSGLLREFFTSIASKLVMLIGILIALSQLGIQITPLLAGLGMVGFIVGFALQDTLSNFASGLMILIYHPFDEGDVIEAAGVSGVVSKLSLVSTTILTFDNQSLVVPNSKIWGDVIRNVTAQTERRVDLVFGIGYSDDIPHAEKVLTEILESHKSVLKTPAPTVKLHTLNDSSVDFVVRPWVKTEDYWNVYWDVTRSVKQRFDEENISIPFPQRDIHLHQDK